MTNTIDEPKVESAMKVPCFLFGIATGAVLALLFAPASGGYTRRLIKRTARNSRDWMKDQAENVSNTAETIHEHLDDAARKVGLA